MKLLTGWGQHSTPGNQGLGTVQTNMLIRLLYGKGQKPSKEYELDVRDMTNIGKLLVYLAENARTEVIMIYYMNTEYS